MGSQLPPGVELAERIGEGGLADVFRGTWNGRIVALKVLREPERPGLRKRFIREGRLLQRLSHPSLVRCHAVLEGIQPMLVLDLLEGQALDQALHDGPLAAEDGVRLAAALLRALTYLHDQGIVHRDIKASNVWLGADRRVVLLDLGLAADASDPLTTTLGDVLGTHAYMAPEQIAGAETDHRVDLYSLGITLYEAMCAERPYHAAGLAGWLAAHRGGGAPPLVERAPDVPVRLASVVDRLMARDPAARPVSAAMALAMLTGTPGMRFELQSPPMVGRDGVLGAIHAVLDGGGVLRVVGELGSGLGLVARRALELSRADGIEFVLLRCRPRLGSEELLEALAADLAEVLGRVPPELDAVVGALSDLVRQDGRVLILVEDLDLAPEGVDLLVDALARVPGVAMLVLGRSLRERPAGRELELRPLDQEEIRQVITRMLGTSAVPPGLDAALWRVSGGLPALAVAVLREQVARGGVLCDGRAEDGRPRWSWNASTPLAPAEDVSRLFERGLRSLPDRSRRVVEVLAVAGEPVPLDLLLAASGADPSGLDLGPALRMGLLAVELHGGEEWVRLRRSALEPIFLRGLDEGRIQSTHLDLADAASQRVMREWEHRFMRLHLARGARDPDDTGRLVELGDWLLSGGRPEEALEILDVAAQLPLDGVDMHTRLAVARGESLITLGRLPEARAAIDAGRALVAEVTDVAVRHRVGLAHLELALELGSPPSAEARALVEGDRRSARARFLAGRLRVLGGDPAEARRAFEAALSLSDPGPVDRVAVSARVALAALDAEEGRIGDGAAALRTLSAELRAVGRPLAAAGVIVRAADLATRDGRLSVALDLIRASREILADRGAPWVIADGERARARIHLCLGDPWGALEILEACASAGDAPAPYPVRRAWLETLAEARLACGDTPAALAAHLRALEAASTLPDEVVRSFNAGMVAVLTAQPGPLTEAVEALANFGAINLLARLLRLGGVVGRDAEVLEGAEAEARRAGDLPLLLDILYARRIPELRAEARSLCERMSEGLFGPLASRFAEAPVSRWAGGERGRGRRDTGG